MKKHEEKQLDYDILKKMYQKEFLFLKTYGFDTINEVEDASYYQLMLKNKTTGLKLHYEVKDSSFFVYFCELINNEYKENPLMITKETALTEYNLDDLIILLKHDKAKSSHVKKYTHKGIEYQYDVTPVEEQIINKAAMLKLYGKNILQGDFSIVPELEKIVKQRIKADTE